MIDETIQRSFTEEIHHIAKQAQMLPGAEQAMRSLVGKKNFAAGGKIPEKIKEFVKKHPVASGAIGGYTLAGLLKGKRREEE